jgi:hypothetical protein
MTFAGMTQEMPFDRVDVEHLSLDRLQLIVETYIWPEQLGLPFASLSGTVIDDIPVPEPTTLSLFLMATAVAVAYRTARH